MSPASFIRPPIRILTEGCTKNREKYGLLPNPLQLETFEGSEKKMRNLMEIVPAQGVAGFLNLFVQSSGTHPQTRSREPPFRCLDG